MMSKIVLVVCFCVLATFAAADSENADDVAISENEVLSRSTRGTCEYNDCNAFCRKLGHARGVCIGTYCQCRSRRRRSLDRNDENEKEIVAGPLPPVPAVNEDVSSNVGVSRIGDVVLSRSRRSCGAGECNEHCKKLGHARGVCIGTYCQCRSRRRRSVPVQNVETVNEVVAAPLPVVPLTVNDEVPSNNGVSPSGEKVLSRTRRSCGANSCNQLCRKLGHVRGVCIGTYCQCRFQ